MDETDLPILCQPRRRSFSAHKYEGWPFWRHAVSLYPVPLTYMFISLVYRIPSSLWIWESFSLDIFKQLNTCELLFAWCLTQSMHLNLESLGWLSIGLVFIDAPTKWKLTWLLTNSVLSPNAGFAYSILFIASFLSFSDGNKYDLPKTVISFHISLLNMKCLYTQQMLILLSFYLESQPERSGQGASSA